MGKLERKFGKYAIPGLIRFLILGYGIGLIIQVTNPVNLAYLSLNPYLILKGEVWRLVTWLVIPPGTTNLFFFLLMCYFYYMIGMQLENVWGAWKFNVYVFGGIFFTILGAFLLMGYYYLVDYDIIRLGEEIYFAGRFGGMTFYGAFIGAFSTYYVNMSLFLAFAATFPDMQVLIMFIIPIRVKWLAVIYAVMLFYYCLSGGIAQWVVIGSSLLNFLLFLCEIVFRLVEALGVVLEPFAFFLEFEEVLGVFLHV